MIIALPIRLSAFWRQKQYEFQIKSVDDCKVTCVVAAGGLQAAEDLLAQELSARGVEALVITSGQEAIR